MAARLTESRDSRVATLVDEALEDVVREDVPVSTVLDKAIRVARLRADYQSLVWLQMEARAAGDEEAKNRAFAEGLAHLPESEYRSLVGKAIDAYLIERRVELDAKEALMSLSVRELEARLETLTHAEPPPPPDGMHPVDLYALQKETREVRTVVLRSSMQFREVLARIRNRLHDYLSGVEKEVLLDEAVSDIFARSKRYVDEQLQRVAPAAFEQLLAAYRRRADQTPEGRSHALMSCRRAIKTVADALYPATGDTVAGADGLERTMSDDKFIARLLQFLADQSGSHTSTDLVAARLKDLGRTLEALNALASKGVHASVSDFEVDQCVIQTYLTLGDILRAANVQSPEPTEVEESQPL